MDQVGLNQEVLQHLLLGTVPAEPLSRQRKWRTELAHMQAAEFVEATRTLAWCIGHGKVCWPVWLPREHPLIKEADRRSRLSIPHERRSPSAVLQATNAMTMRLWDKPLSFDQMASHKTAVCIKGNTLPFNTFCLQPGAAGVDACLPPDLAD